MKSLAQGVKVGVLVLIVVAAAFFVWKSISERTAGTGGVPYWARFRDASGLAGKSRVVIAGLTVGEIQDRRLEGRYAKVTIKVKKGTEIWSNATIFKKSSSLLGEYYLEVDPGTEFMEGADGKMVQNTLLPEGAEIPTVIEASTPDQLIRQVGETLPKVNDALEEVKLLVRDVRKLVNTEIKSIAETVDTELKKDSKLIGDILARVDKVVANVEGISRDVKRVTGGADQRIDQIFDNLEAATGQANELLVETRKGIAEASASVKTTLANIDDAVGKVDGAVESFQSTFDRTSSIAKKIDDDEGTLGRLVNDPTIADNVESITSDARTFSSTVFGLQTIVGLRTEYNYRAGAFKTAFSVKLQTRPQRFYFVEVVDDPRGSITPTWTQDPVSGDLQTSVIVEDAIRFTFQFGRQFDWLTLRIGIKESTGGAGVDVDFFDEHLQLSLDVFDASFDDLPRLKLLAAYHFFKYFYVVAGVDDVLNEPGELTVTGMNLTGVERKYVFGRDVFGGVMLTFNDQDLSALLFLAGGAIAGLGSGK